MATLLRKVSGHKSNDEQQSMLTLTKAQASELVRTMGVLVVGATMTDQGPALKGEAIPPDVQELIDCFSSETLFVKNSGRIIAGIRAEVS